MLMMVTSPRVRQSFGFAHVVQLGRGARFRSEMLEVRILSWVLVLSGSHRAFQGVSGG